MSREAMKLALKALELSAVTVDSFGVQQKTHEAITSLREALAEQQQEPVTWMEMVVANLVREGVNKHKARELAQHFYTSPPAQRKPLTDEAIATVYWGATGQSLRPQDNVLAHNFARAIEAAHGIKEST